MSRVFEVGDRVLLIDQKKRRYLIVLKPAGEFHSHAGIVSHDAVIGRPEGTTIRSSRTQTYLAIRPTLSDFVLKMPRGAQVIYPKDLGPILMLADLYPGARVLESGLGSGALSMAMLRAGAEIVGYEMREDFAEKAQTNIASFLGDDAMTRYRVEIRDCYEGIDETDLDRIVLDLPEPWRVVPHAETSLHPGGILLAYTPSIVQVMQLREALEHSAFDLAETVEVLNRTWHVEGQAVRPDHRMVAHTGFLTPRGCSRGDRPVPTGFAVSWLDVVLVGLAVAAIVGGYRLGFVTRVVSWIGLGIGLVVALRLTPILLRWLDPTRPAISLAIVVALLVVGASLGQALGFVIGARLRPRRTEGLAAGVDGVFGAFAGLAGLVAIVWLLLPVLTVAPAWVARPVTTSYAAQAIDTYLPPPPDAVETLRDLVGDDPFPDVFAALRPTPDLGPPPPETGISEATSDDVARSVVKIEGEACSRIQDGSGWVVAPGQVVTNAHVVAGEGRTQVIRDDGRRLDATVTAFDPSRDLAVLSVAGLERPPLPVSREIVSGGTIGGVFGHPGGEPLRIAPFEVARALRATGRDIYGGTTTRRDVLELSASLRPGDSGSALVDPGGRVVGVAFAIAHDQPDVAYALATSELEPVLAASADAEPVPTGSCLS